MDYYIVKFELDSKQLYCIWYTDDIDGFIVDQNTLIQFLSLDDLKQYCITNKIILNSFEVSDTNIDYFIGWIQSPQKAVDCQLFLDFWNTMADLASSIQQDFLGNEDGIYLDIYNKLFYGNNLPAIKGDAEEYIPTWDSEDIDALSKVIEDGVRLAKASIKLS